ncbi:hypothetical protein SAMN05444161_3263 [Rhizobiales bacterium GAS191]|nr:hypothetical protein SAMN05444161_3263 [Rhizobiales bacterium GAS191]
MTKPKLKLQIAHQVPGRVRMKIPSAKGNTELLQQIGETFGKIPGIDQITVNATTGSIVLHYDADQHDEFSGRLQHHYQQVSPRGQMPPHTEIDDLARKIEDEAEFLAKNSESARVIVDFFKELDHQIKFASGNTIDLKIVLAFGIIGFTVLEVGATAATPVWVTLSLFALNHFIEMRSPHLAGAPAMAPVIVQS